MNKKISTVLFLMYSLLPASALEGDEKNNIPLQPLMQIEVKPVHDEDIQEPMQKGVAVRPMKICFLLGYPGSGKGTLAQSLDEQNYVNFSFGDFLRKEVKKGTDLGNTFKDKIEMRSVKEMTLMPEEHVRNFFKTKMKELILTQKNIILDGFPKTIEQAEFFDSFTKEEGIDVFVIFVNTDKKMLRERIFNRRTCDKCNRAYNLIYNPPKKKDTCDKCEEELVVRATDSLENTIKRENYFDKIMDPILSYYREKNLLIELNGNLPIEETCMEFHTILQRLGFPINTSKQ